MKYALIIVTVLLSGCIHFAWYNKTEPTDLAIRNDTEICGAYNAALNQEARSRIKEEINRRKLISEDDWENVQLGKVGIGIDRKSVV